MYRCPIALLRHIFPRQAMPPGGSVWVPAGRALALLACLIVAGCTQRDSSADDNRPGGFYGGVGGGMTHQ
jgi:hypothetical protein